MTEIEKMYVMFRQEIDTYAAETIINNLDVRPVIEKGKMIGFLMLEYDYIDAFYIKPEYRQKGIGKRFIVQQYNKDGKKWEHLHIVKANIPALKFWESIFELQVLEENFCDYHFLILGLRGGIDAGNH